MRKILYLSGTRADFGLMHQTLQAIHAAPKFELQVAVVGMHLDPDYGNTVTDIERSGLHICTRLPLNFSVTDGASMARGIGQLTASLTDVMVRESPDILLVLGDRGEMLAGAIAAVHLGIALVHIHGGERSGTIDESVRHAISKLAHFHLTATAAARERLLRMGEREEAVFVTGAPGLDRLGEMALDSRAALCSEIGFDPQRPMALLLFHPDLYEPAGAEFMLPMVDAMLAAGVQVLIAKPNADAGSERIREQIDRIADRGDVHVVTHLARPTFLAWMARADVMVGNSSAGIIEAASFDTPVINVGNRQRLRERNDNLVDVEHDIERFVSALGRALKHQRDPAPTNIYGDGKATGRICHILASLDIGPQNLSKINVY